MLKGSNVLLRPIEIDDIEIIAGWKNDREITNLTNTYLPVTLTQEEALYDQDQESSNNFKFIIEVDNKPIGYCGISNINWQSRRGEYLIRIAEKLNWGKGYGLESTKLILDFAFTDLNLNKVFLSCFDDNETALKLYENLHFKIEGTLKNHTYCQGTYKNMIILSIFKNEWYKN